MQTNELRGEVGVTSVTAVDPHAPGPTPERALLDRLARWLEGSGRGEDVPAGEPVVDLAEVLAPDELARLAPSVRRFYEAPAHARVRAGVDGDVGSRLLLALFARLARQSDLPDRGEGFEGYPVGQRCYRDAAARVHWDRYAWVDGAWRRLFTARVGTVAARRRFVETFVIWGVPVPLVFEPSVEGDALTLTLRPLESSPLAWLARVRYRTTATDDGVRAEGDFRVPPLLFRVRTEFRARFG